MQTRTLIFAVLILSLGLVYASTDELHVEKGHKVSPRTGLSVAWGYCFSLLSCFVKRYLLCSVMAVFWAKNYILPDLTLPPVMEKKGLVSFLEDQKARSSLFEMWIIMAISTGFCFLERHNLMSNYNHEVDKEIQRREKEAKESGSVVPAGQEHDTTYASQRYADTVLSMIYDGVSIFGALATLLWSGYCRFTSTPIQDQPIQVPGFLCYIPAMMAGFFYLGSGQPAEKSQGARSSLYPTCGCWTYILDYHFTRVHSMGGERLTAF